MPGWARHRWPSGREGAPPLGGKLSRSLRSLRPIAAASVVTGPRRFPEGAWTHPVPATDDPRTDRRWNEDPKPFIWAKSAEEIFETITAYLKRINDSEH